jgi:dUTP pyrophosphatase
MNKGDAAQILVEAVRREKKLFDKFCEKNNVTGEEKKIMKGLRMSAIEGVCNSFCDVLERPVRGFERVENTNLNPEDIILPRRSTIFSAGYDFYSPIDCVIGSGEQKSIPSGVKAYMLSDEVLKIYPRSSMGVKKHLILPNSVGIIDSDYYNNSSNEGHIMIFLYNYDDEPHAIHKGDKIAQGIFQKFLVGEDVPVDLRDGGIGSTGK